MKDQDFYTTLSRQADAGYRTVTCLLPKVRDDRLRYDMARHMAGYRHFSRIARDGLACAKEKEEKENPLSHLPARMGIAVGTLFNRSRAHIAEMMISASHSGTLQLQRQLNRLQTGKGNEEAAMLCEKMMAFEQENIKCMQKYI